MDWVDIKGPLGEELAALAAVFGESVEFDASKLPDSVSVCVELSSADLVSASSTKSAAAAHIKLWFNVGVPKSNVWDEAYSAPPTFFFGAETTLTPSQRELLGRQLQQVYLDKLGEPILYDWVEAARDFLSRLCLKDSSVEQSSTEEESLHHAASAGAVDWLESDWPLPEIVSGTPITDRKSTFQAHVAQVEHPDQVHLVLAQLKTNGKVARATHNMVAYRIFSRPRAAAVRTLCKTQNQPAEAASPLLIKHMDCVDDGEIGAGAKLLHLMEILDVKNVLVIVTRWYGGIHLGPDRFKHICNVARDILAENGFLDGGKLGAKQQNQVHAKPKDSADKKGIHHNKKHKR